MSDDLAARVAALEAETGRLADIQAIRKLQHAYGYFMDKCLFSEIVDLFVEDCELRFMGGIFRGKAGARRLYGGASGLNGPSDGMLFEHLIVQDIIDIAPDRSTAQGRFRTFMQGGIHHSKTDAPPSIPPQFLEGGVYENIYVREEGVWKFKLFDYTVVWQADFSQGWAHSPDNSLMVSAYPALYPENPRGPDAYGAPARRWPKAVVVPFHYVHPVTGKVIEVPPAV